MLWHEKLDLCVEKLIVLGSGGFSFMRILCPGMKIDLLVDEKLISLGFGRICSLGERCVPPEKLNLVEKLIRLGSGRMFSWRILCPRMKK